MSSEPVLEFDSHVAGKNAKVKIWPDRIEWTKKGHRRGTSGKAMFWTMGLSLAAAGSRVGSETNTIPIRSIQGITTSKYGMGYTTVKVATASDVVVDFRVSKDKAENVRTTLLRLMNAPPPTAPQPVQQPVVVMQAPPPSPSPPQAANPAPPPQAPPVVDDPADQLRKLKQLRDDDLITEEEFHTKRAEIMDRL